MTLSVNADTVSGVNVAAVTPISVWLGLLLGLLTAGVYRRYCVPYGMAEDIRNDTLRAFVHTVVAAGSWAVIIVYFSTLGLMLCGAVSDTNLLVTTVICSLILFITSRYSSARSSVSRRDKE
jgi:hypothetical protein